MEKEKRTVPLSPETTNQARIYTLYNQLRMEGFTDEEILAGVAGSPTLPRFLMQLGSRVQRTEMAFQDFAAMKELLQGYTV